MQKLEYEVKHQYQPTNTSCSPTALSILLSYYDVIASVKEISEKVPQVQNQKGENSGTINQQLATWCIEQGFDVSLYTFDCQIIDMSWADLPKEKIIQRLQAAKDGWEIPALGSLWSNAYRQSYVDLLKAGGNLHILPAVTSKLLYSLLENGPILPLVCFNTLYGKGRSRNDGEIESIPDDINGKAMNHSIVIYGVNPMGNFLIADPWEKPGRHIIEPERLIAAISTAQIECDNLLFQLKKK